MFVLFFLKGMLEWKLKSKNQMINPNILLIHWHRIIVDEFHELFTNTKNIHLEAHIWLNRSKPFENIEKTLNLLLNYLKMGMTK